MLQRERGRVRVAMEPESSLALREQAPESELGAWLVSAFEDAAIGIALVDLDSAASGRVLRVNPALCELTGRPRRSLEGSDAGAMLHPEDHARCGPRWPSWRAAI